MTQLLRRVPNNPCMNEAVSGILRPLQLRVAPVLNFSGVYRRVLATWSSCWYRAGQPGGTLLSAPVSPGIDLSAASLSLIHNGKYLMDVSMKGTNNPFISEAAPGSVPTPPLRAAPRIEIGVLLACYSSMEIALVPGRPAWLGALFDWECSGRF